MRPVQIAPDLTIDERRDIAAVCVELGVDGVVACNSTVSRPAALTSTERGESGVVDLYMPTPQLLSYFHDLWLW